MPTEIDGKVYYAEDEHKELLTKSVTGARTGQYNKGRDDFKGTLLEKIKGTPGFEEAADFDAVFEEVIPLASARKKNAKHDETNAKLVESLKGEISTSKEKYKKAVVRAALSGEMNGFINPEQVTLLLQSKYKFDVIEEDGLERLAILGPNGKEIVGKDGFTPISVQDIIADFKEKNPHFVSAEEKKTIGDGKSKTGSPGVASGLKDIMAKEPKDLTDADKKALNEGVKAGKIQSVKGKLVLQE